MPDPSPRFGLTEDQLHFWIEHNCDDGTVHHDEYPPNLPKVMLERMTPQWRILDTRELHLTVDPNITCDSCPLDGFIRNGDWQPVEVPEPVEPIMPVEVEQYPTQPDPEDMEVE